MAAASGPAATIPDGVDPVELKARADEKRAIELADADDLFGALEAVNEVLAAQPGRPSALNNRAQVCPLHCSIVSWY